MFKRIIKAILTPIVSEIIHEDRENRRKENSENPKVASLFLEKDDMTILDENLEKIIEIFQDFTKIESVQLDYRQPISKYTVDRLSIDMTSISELYDFLQRETETETFSETSKDFWIAVRGIPHGGEKKHLTMTQICQTRDEFYAIITKIIKKLQDNPELLV